jgi:plastocyanin
MKRLLLIAAFAVVAASARAGQEAMVVIDNFVFTPATLTINAGTKVVFRNHDDSPHNVVDDKGDFRSNALDTDETFARVFDKPGEFVYFCGLHPRMKGKIIVTP